MKIHGEWKWLRLIFFAVLSVIPGVIVTMVYVLGHAFDVKGGSEAPNTPHELIAGLVLLVLFFSALAVLPSWVVYRHFRNRKVAIVLLLLSPVAGIGIWFLGVLLLILLLGSL